MSGMSVLSKISTFFTTTLLCMYAFLLRPFVPRPARHTSSVTPYPLAPDLEGRVIEIAGGSGKCAEKGTDLEQGIFTDRAEQTDLFSGPQALAPKQQRAPNARGISRAMSRSSFTGVKGMKDKTIPAPPLSVVTNSVRPPAPPHKRAASKATGENTALPPRKPTPLRRMPRYLNLTGTSPTKPALTLSVKHCPGGSSKRRSSLACPGDRTAPRKSVSFATATSSPCISPPKFEPRLRPSRPSVDFAARVRSVFYKRDGIGASYDSVRHLFDRDSLYSLYSRESDSDAEDDDDYGTPLSLRSTCYSPSKLPYLRDSVSSAGTSRSSSVFNDLLASVDRKYPAYEWTDIVQLPEEREASGNPYGGGAEEPWSDVFCLEDYAV